MFVSNHNREKVLCILYSVFIHLQILFSGEHLGHPKGLAHYDNFVFWTEFQHGLIQRLNLVDKTITRVIKENPPLYQIRVFDVGSQSGMN